MFRRLEMFVGPVYSGKTTALIEHCELYDKKKLYLKFTRKIRKGKLKAIPIKSHCGEHEVEGYLVNTLDDVLVLLERFPDVEGLFFDEVQFISDWKKYPFIVENKDVYISGLDMDHRGRPFEVMGVLMCTASDIHKYKGTCSFCDGEEFSSEFSVLTDPDEDTSKSVIERDVFQPACRQCFYEKVRS